MKRALCILALIAGCLVARSASAQLGATFSIYYDPGWDRIINSLHNPSAQMQCPQVHVITYDQAQIEAGGYAWLDERTVDPVYTWGATSPPSRPASYTITRCDYGYGYCQGGGTCGSGRYRVYFMPVCRGQYAGAWGATVFASPFVNRGQNIFPWIYGPYQSKQIWRTTLQNCAYNTDFYDYTTLERQNQTTGVITQVPWN